MTRITESHARPDWHSAWRELAQLTNGVEPDDELLWPIMQALHQADECFKRADWAGFQRAANEVRRIVEGKDADSG